MDEITLVDYDDQWPTLFAQEKALVLDALTQQNIATIEHFGSTAIRCLIAKPIIDIMILVPDLRIARKAFPERLRALEYKYWADNPKTDRLFFVKGMPPFGRRRSHHIHVGEAGGALSERVKFCDFLNKNADKRQEYARLKQQAALDHADDREAYTDAKADFITTIMQEIEALEKAVS